MRSSSSFESSVNVTMPSMSAGREAGVDDRRARRFGRELQLAATGVLRELGLADAGDDRVAVHEFPIGWNTGSSTPSCSR